MNSASRALNEIVVGSFEAPAFEAEGYGGWSNEMLFEDENSYEWQGEFEPDEGESYEAYDYESYGDYENFGDFEGYGGDWEAGYASGTGLSQSEIDQLASELMALETPEEADEFLGRIFKGARKLVKFARPLLAKVAPLAGAGLGSIVPGLGTAFGGMAGKALGSLLGGGGGGRGRRRPMRRRRRRRGRGGNPFGRFLRQGGNPLSAVLQSGLGKGLLGRLLGGEMENASDAEAQFDLARRTVRALDDLATEMSGMNESEFDYDERAAEAMTRVVNANLPEGIRPALIETRRI